MPDLTIVNTSPLFYLHRIGLLEVLHKLYGKITIPEAAKKELEKG
jgi:predicted nucleic acid-binding protein